MSIEKDMWITFEVRKQSNELRDAAVNARRLTSSMDDYHVGRNYLGVYGEIDGFISRQRASDLRIKASIKRQVLLTFFKEASLRKLILDDIYARRSVDVEEWTTLLKSMTEEEIRGFEFDEGRLEPSTELSLCLFAHLHRPGLLKRPGIVSLVAKPESEPLVRRLLDGFLNESDVDDWLSYVAASPKADERLLSRLFHQTYSKRLFETIGDNSSIIRHYDEAGLDELRQFLTFVLNNLPDEQLQRVYNELSSDSMLRGLKALPEDVCIQFLNRLPDEAGIAIATSEAFRLTSVFGIYIGERWEESKSEVPYVVFDIESDGEVIREFAFCSEDNMRSYQGEEQIGSLIRRLKRLPIIVGHNIKQWDLPILYKKGLSLPPSTFVWDTLEMEILLNPCRYAYSLHAQHKAEADTALANDLFWNQLYRLSSDERLVDSLRGFLPAGITHILEDLRQPYFQAYFHQTANPDRHIFHELRPLSAETLGELEHISAIPSGEPTLIIAPRNIWARLAQYVPLSFPSEKAPPMSLDEEKLRRSPVDDLLKRTILERFCHVSKTPLVCNLAHYLRVEAEGKTALTYEFLEPYLSVFCSHIDCVDVSGFECPRVVQTDYKHIFTIGAELDDRVHKCRALEDRTFADLLLSGSKLPFTMASVNMAPVEADEISRLGIRMPELAANVWVERQRNGLFSFWLNYKYQAYRAHFLSHFSVRPKPIKWTFAGSDQELVNLAQVSRSKTAYMPMRVSQSTTERSRYWVFQFALIGKIHAGHADKPIVYIVNDEDEVEGLASYARSLGYYVPSQGSGFRRLEYVGSHSNGMVIIGKQEFLDGIGSYRTDRAYCYIWDNMDIDRYMLMWDKLPFDDDIEEDVDDERDDKDRHSTPRQCIHAAWPIYKHYSEMVMAGNKQTRCFIIDPYFDDYEDIACSCHAQAFKVSLWDSAAEYEKALSESSNYFDDSRQREEGIGTEDAMELLRRLFIYGFDWKETQKEVLPHMLEKRGDCLVSMPTGEGKSVCFQGPALLRASFSRKLSIVISPLRALMQDQVEGLQRRGFQTNVDYLSGDRQRPEVEAIYRRLRSGQIALLFITPERMRVRSFVNVLYERMQMDGGLEYVVFDEAHCISQWGQEFRPDYRNAVLTLKELRQHFDFMFAMFSATVTSQVEADLRSFLPDLCRLGQSADDYNPIRQHITICPESTAHPDNARIEKITQFICEQQIDFEKSCMIIFCRTRRQCEETEAALSRAAEKATPGSPLSECAGRIGFYHAGMDAEERAGIYERFRRTDGLEPLYVLCATKAFGMGMDIPNIHYVAHYSPPSVLEDYLQEVGRAGRDEGMYRQAFPDGRQIPALCLASADDFKKLKELLVKSQMSWSNLTDAQDKIVEYITRFQTLEQTRQMPIVVPFDVWSRNPENPGDTTSCRMAFHWLETIGSIKLGYLSMAHMDLTIKQRNVARLALLADPVLAYLLDNTEGERSLVSIDHLRSSLRVPLPKIMNSLVRLMKDGRIEINETIRCSLIQRRYLEARYMVEHDKNEYALHIAFEGLRRLLADCKEKEERSIGRQEREQIALHLMDNVSYPLYQEEYMPWKEGAAAAPRMAVVRYETFKRNITGRMGSQMFSILYYLPMVDYNTERQEQEFVCHITVKDGSWRPYLDQLEADCFKMLKHIVKNPDPINWAKTIIDFGWTKEESQKGYRYMEDVLAVLHHLAYADHSPLFKTGIEVIATETTDMVIDDGEDDQSPMFHHRKTFDEQERLKKIRLASINMFFLIGEKESRSDFIRRYFQCRNYDDYLGLLGDYVPEGSDIMEELTEEALKAEEKRLDDNAEQKAIYEQPKNQNVNVMAGPGSGKTHVLTLRCARLIYREHVEPSRILVLAYNRAVVVEMKNRLNTLFTKLGLSSMAHMLHVYTFHAMAKKCLGQRLDSVPPERWEMVFLDYLKSAPTDFKAHFPNIEFVLVDEFQDITQARLEALTLIHHCFDDARFFTIGDINQSIYGFDRVPKDHFGNKMKLSPEEYARIIKPQPYYDKWTETISPIQLSMSTNYRSYQQILDKAAEYITEGHVPRSAASLMRHEPQGPYVFEVDNSVEQGRQWFAELPAIIDWAIKENEEAARLDNPQQRSHRHVGTIAIFFRTNNEVYQGYSIIKDMLPQGVRLRIQGESATELWREREIYHLINILEKHPDQPVDVKNNKTLTGIKSFLKKQMDASPAWSPFLLDMAFCLVLDYVDSIRSDSETHTWQDMADYIKDIASRDDVGHAYKVYDNYKQERLLPEPRLNIVLTTMHKVKGLEFDVVITTPSTANLPTSRHHQYEQSEPPQPDDMADMEEERRLTYVAYTRAKKRLYIFKGDREHALDKGAIYSNAEPEHRYAETKPGLNNYFLSFLANDYLFKTTMPYVMNNVKKDDPVDVCRDRCGNYVIRHNNNPICSLSKNSTIRNRAARENIPLLTGFYVSSIAVWTLNDTVSSDDAEGTDFQKYWSEAAKQQGYVLIVQIAGFGKPINTGNNATN